MKTNCIILAAGQGTRMKSKTPKVLHSIGGKPLGGWVIDAAKQATGTTPVLVVGKNAEVVMEAFGDSVEYAVQTEQLGTGHAVMSAKGHLKGDGFVIIVAGDMPLIQASTLEEIISEASANKLGACLLSAVVGDPHGYGRVVRGSEGVTCIVEHKDATDEQRTICEINASVYCFNTPLLLEALEI